MSRDLQNHVLARALELPARARDLHRDLRAQLVRGSNRGLLATSPQNIMQHVKLLPKLPQQVAEQLHAERLLQGASCIVGGEKNQNRNRDVAHLARDDGAWFDFSIVVREVGTRLDLLAYDFEIRFSHEVGGVPFLRFDYNLPGHRNETREMRCHLHPGSDDILVPAPLMSPSELLAMFVDEMRRPTARADPRSPTAFELGWLGQRHAFLTRPQG